MTDVERKRQTGNFLVLFEEHSTLRDRSETRFERKLVASKLFQSSEREKSGVKYPRKGDSVSCSGECQSCAINVRRLNENKDCRRKFEEVTSKSSVTSVGSYGSFIIKSKTQNVKDVNQL